MTKQTTYALDKRRKELEDLSRKGALPPELSVELSAILKTLQPRWQAKTARRLASIAGQGGRQAVFIRAALDKQAPAYQRAFQEVNEALPHASFNDRMIWAVMYYYRKSMEGSPRKSGWKNFPLTDQFTNYCPTVMLSTFLRWKDKVEEHLYGS